LFFVVFIPAYLFSCFFTFITLHVLSCVFIEAECTLNVCDYSVVLPSDVACLHYTMLPLLRSKW